MVSAWCAKVGESLHQLLSDIEKFVEDELSVWRSLVAHLLGVQVGIARDRITLKRRLHRDSFKESV